MAKILVIHPEAQTGALITQILQREGLEVFAAANSAEGIAEFQRTNPDLVIAAEMLPLIERKEFVTHLRDMSDVPLIILGEKNESTLIVFLALGADTYLYPFDPKELVAKVHSLLRRRRKRVNSDFPFLTPTESTLLTYLARNENRVVTIPELIVRVWRGKDISKGSLKFYIHRLRKKVDGNFRLVNHRGVGYCLQTREVVRIGRRNGNDGSTAAMPWGCCRTRSMRTIRQWW